VTATRPAGCENSIWLIERTEAGATEQVKLRTHGGDRKGDGARADQGADGTLKRGSNSNAYLRARLSRDRPDKERLDRGEFPSVRQAAIAAGIVKVPTPLEAARRALAKLTPAERKVLCLELSREFGAADA
jgi:hypothetical protein